ncbi:MAG: hypothetical protein K1X72_04280 [Pyrinomonadaceae bacterium]|nr:hypothetical protein [Pyrinomonadaceae bacterium]
MSEVKVDISEVEKLGADFQKIGKWSLVALAQRGLNLLRAEVPVRSGNLKQKGIKEPEYDFEKLQAILTVSATSEALKEGEGTLHLPSGNTKKVRLRPQPPFNYTTAVARGRAKARPRTAKVLLIPVSSVPSDESYITAGNQIYILRMSAKATKPNPFDERAAKRLKEESPAIVQKVVDAVLK